MFLTVVD